MVNTPLWTYHPDKIKAVSWKKVDVVLEPGELAEAMLKLVEGEEYPGDTLREVLAKGNWRKMEVDRPVAVGKRAIMSNMHAVTRDTIGILKGNKRRAKMGNEAFCKCIDIRMA